MSTNKVTSEKTLTVISVKPVMDIATGGPACQVSFGEYVDYNDPNNLMKTIPADKLTLHVLYIEPFPYMIGSKWKLITHENNSFSLVEP